MSTYTRDELNAAVHNAVESAVTGLQVNSQTDTGMRQRIAAAVAGGYDFADTLHNIYLDYGYPLSLQFFNFWNMYRRLGVARRVVELYPDQTWMDAPIITSNSAAYLRELEKLNKRLGLWRRMKGLDTRQRVGRYAGMFMRVRDGLSPEMPLDSKLGGEAALVAMVPLYESQLKVLATDDNPVSDNFDMPTMYQFNGGAEGSRDEKASSSFSIHPSRIVIASEDSDNGGIYGIPVLESIYNSLMDFRKIIGGGGEGFYKNAAQSIVFNLQDASSATTNASLLAKFNTQYDEFSQNRSRRAMWTPGMDAKVLDSNLVSPKEFADNTLLDISAGSSIPVALLVGNQTGRLAGDQDTKGFLSLVQARREDFGSDMVNAVLTWCAKAGILPSEEYEIEWPDAMAPSQDERLANATKMADVNQKQFLSGGDVPFSGEEIREAAGYDPEEMEDLPPPDETIDDDADEATE